MHLRLTSNELCNVLNYLDFRLFRCKDFCGRGDKHEGMYVKDKRHGWGIYVWSNGDKYVGNWGEGMMNGRGTFLWAKVTVQFFVYLSARH